ncbi:MAG TPA: hypothetical protein VIG80_14360 [Bacillaceae bacterium]
MKLEDVLPTKITVCDRNGRVTDTINKKEKLIKLLVMFVDERFTDDEIRPHFDQLVSELVNEYGLPEDIATKVILEILSDHIEILNEMELWKVKKFIRWYRAYCGRCGRETEHSGVKCERCGS